LRECYVTHFNDLEKHLRAQNAGKQPVEILIVSLLRPYCAHADSLTNAAWTVPSVGRMRHATTRKSHGRMLTLS